MFQKQNLTNSNLIKMKKKRKTILQESNDFKSMIDDKMPSNDDCYKLISIDNFSSIALISYVSKKEIISKLYVSTFRIGKKQFNELTLLKQRNLLDYVNLFTSFTQEKVDAKMMYKGKEYNYYEYIKLRCHEYNWNITSCDNHSKVLLIETKKGNHYVIETSSNLNENPKIEQFSIENDLALFEFYRKNIFERS